MSRTLQTTFAKLSRQRRRVGSIGSRWISGARRDANDEASLVPAARTKLRNLGLVLPSPFSAEALCAQVSERRGRPILIHEVPTFDPDAPCGLWLETADADHFLVARGVSMSHRAHIILHELSHVIYDHQGILGSPHLPLIMPNLHPSLVARMLARSASTSRADSDTESLEPVIKRALGRGSNEPHEEREAETLASVIMEQVGREQERRADGHDREVLANLSQMFE